MSEMEEVIYIGNAENNAYAHVKIMNNKKGRVLNNFLLHSSPTYEQQIIDKLCEYALTHVCKFITTMPKTQTMYDALLTNGFEVVYSDHWILCLEKEFD